jgi:biotin carboxyl carrier protein
MHYEIDVAGRLCQVVVHRTDDTFLVSVDGREWTVGAARVDALTLSLCLSAHGQRGPILSREVTLAPDGPTGQTRVTVDARPVQVALNGRRRQGRRNENDPAGSGPQRVTAPMPGKIVRILVKVGDAVDLRQPLIVVEAMKMENELRASGAGRVTDLHVREGQLVDAGAVLAVIHAG